MEGLVNTKNQVKQNRLNAMCRTAENEAAGSVGIQSCKTGSIDDEPAAVKATLLIDELFEELLISSTKQFDFDFDGRSIRFLQFHFIVDQ